MSHFFLPPLHNKAKVTTGSAGDWNYQPTVAFDDVAESLKLDTVANNAQTVSSIPDMWARPLLVDNVLRDSAHPLHEKIKAQWKGMLAAIALAEVNGFKLSASLVDLSQPKNDAFISSLLKLIPDKQKTLYQLDNGRQNPWEKIYVFIWEKKINHSFLQTEKIAVGIISPATIVCPAEDGDWTGLPWYNDNRLQSPIHPADELTDDEKIQLRLWLDNLLNELSNDYATKIKELIREFQWELDNSLTINFTNQQSHQQLRPSTKQQYFKTRIALGNLQTLNNPIGRKIENVEESSVKLNTKNLQSSAGVLFLADFKKLLEQWEHKKPKDIQIYDTSLASFNIQEFRSKYKGEYLTEADLFLDDFFFLKGSNKLLPGALLPKGTEEIKYNHNNKEYPLTPLLPIQSKLFDYFTPEELNKMITLRPINLEVGSGVSVSMTLPLSGGDYTTSHEYLIREDNAITQIPFLEVFPNFRAEGWQEYYVFYFDDRTDKSQNIFQIDFLNALEIHPPELENFQITRLNNFPSYIICRNHESPLEQGVILLKTSEKVGNQDPNETWTVGVDFGTSFTNVYYQTNRNPKPLTLSPLNLQVTATSPASRQRLLYDYFMSAEEKGFPLSTVLTNKGNKGQGRPVFDGRVYIPPENLETFNPDSTHIKTALKWSKENLPFNKLFLKHLALQISAEAAKNHVRKIEWAVSYPSSFSLEDKSNYFTTWKNIIEELGQKTGMIHQWLPKAKGSYFRTEALAMAQYLADHERKEDLQYTTCIDMGGGTSDISIWQGNKLLHQCSIQLAGHTLFSQFLKQKVNFINEQFKVDLSELANNLIPEPFYAKLDALLMAKGGNWLKDERGEVNHPDLDYVIQLSALGISGLYYYIGKILEGLTQEGEYKENKNTPVYIGGNGSRILHWLSSSGEFNSFCEAHRLFSRMLSKGSGFVDTNEQTILSSFPKAEVACGLVLNQHETRLKGLDEDKDNEIFAGEECYVNGQSISETSRLHLEGTIEEFSVAELSNLKEFVEAYHKALRELKIKSIKPLSCYRDDKKENQQERERVWEKVKRKVKNYSDNNIKGKNADEIRPEPPFVIGLKALLQVLNQKQDNRGEGDEQN